FFILFFNATATTEIYPLSLHDALPICDVTEIAQGSGGRGDYAARHVVVRFQVLFRRTVVVSADHALVEIRDVDHVELDVFEAGLDRKSTRLNSSHDQISYAVFCLKKKK